MSKPSHANKFPLLINFGLEILNVLENRPYTFALCPMLRLSLCTLLGGTVPIFTGKFKIEKFPY